MMRFMMFSVVLFVSSSCGRSNAYLPRFVSPDSGIPDGSAGCATVTRGVAVEAFYGLLRLECQEVGCSDVSGSSSACAWGAVSRIEAVDLGPSGLCEPAKSMSRAELAKMAVLSVKAFGACQAPAEPTFDDVLPGASHYDYVECAVQLGFIDPSEDRRFNPSEVADRCFMDPMVSRIDRFLGTPRFLMVKALPGEVVPNGAMYTRVSTFMAYGVTRERPFHGIQYMNDLEGAFDTPVPPEILSGVFLSCEEAQTTTSNIESGVHEIPSLALPFKWCGRADRFPLTLNLAFHTWEAYRDEWDSGRRIRLGLASIGTFPVEGAERTNDFVFRKSRPYFTQVEGFTGDLVPGQNILFIVLVTADSAGKIGLARMSFQVDSNVELTGFRLYRGAVQLSSSQVNIFSETADLANGNPLTGNRIGVSFNQEETLVAGETQSYRLEAVAKGVVAGSSISTRMLSDLGRPGLKNPCRNPFTGRIYDTDGSSLYANGAGLSRAKPAEGALLVWSDHSSPSHSYPRVSGGVAMSGSGSCDYTNGWGLGVENLPIRTLVR